MIITEQPHIVQMPEDTWLTMTAADKDVHWAQWRLNAIAAKANRLVLRVMPDALFPSTGRVTPYIVRQEDLAEQQPDFTCDTLTRVTVRRDVWYAVNEDFKKRTELVAKMRDAALKATPPGGRYRLLVDGRLQEIEAGRR